VSIPAHPSGEIEVLLALGANVGDPVAQIREAVRLLRADLTIDRVSSLYRTEPVGFAEQPDFLNLVVGGRTDLSVYELHGRMQAVERAIGRVRTTRDGPRSIDVDLLAYGPLALRSPTLEVPHPRLAQRTFVLVPLLEISPEWRHPLTGRSVTEMLDALAAPSAVSRIGPLEPADPHCGRRDEG
jgi:2-amino-4-hydroxy-6-hydroxymethyldihydropteridine diphosphokinase